MKHVQYTENEYLCLELYNGRTVVGLFSSQNENGITLNGALYVLFREKENGEYILSFAKYCPFIDHHQIFFKYDDISHIHRNVHKTVIEGHSQLLFDYLKESGILVSDFHVMNSLSEDEDNDGIDSEEEIKGMKTEWIH